MKNTTKEKVARTTATYKTPDGPECDLEELAETYSKVGNVPERIGWSKACEITLLAQAFLILYKRAEKNG